MKILKVTIQLAFFVASMVAAYWWYQSSLVPLPSMTWESPERNPFYQALQLSARLNQKAAFATGVSVFLGGFVAMLELFLEGRGKSDRSNC